MISYFYGYKRASLACALRLADIVSTGSALWAPGLTLINYKGDNISKYVCLTVKSISLEKSSNFPINRKYFVLASMYESYSGPAKNGPIKPANDMGSILFIAWAPHF